MSAYQDQQNELNETGKRYHPAVTAPFHYDVRWLWSGGAMSQITAMSMSDAVEWIKERLADEGGRFTIMATNNKTCCDVTNSVKNLLGLDPS